MKNSVAITVIICGTILVALPFVHQIISAQQVVNAMGELGKDVSIDTMLSKGHLNASMVIGSLMIFVGMSKGQFTYNRVKKDEKE